MKIGHWALDIGHGEEAGDRSSLILNFVSAALASPRSLLASRRERHFEF